MLSKKNKGFTFIEIMVVLAIIAILVTIGTIYWSKQVRDKEFNAKFDEMVQQVSEAQALARSYGMDPTGYDSDGSFSNNVQQDYVGMLAVKGLNKTPKFQEYNNVQINFTNFQITSMTESKFNSDFQGAAILYGTKSGSAYTFDKMLIFGPNGAPLTPTGETAPSDTYYEIEMCRRDSGGNYIKCSRLRINSTTGAHEKIIVK